MLAGERVRVEERENVREKAIKRRLGPKTEPLFINFSHETSINSVSGTNYKNAILPIGSVAKRKMKKRRMKERKERESHMLYENKIESSNRVKTYMHNWCR